MRRIIAMSILLLAAGTLAGCNTTAGKGYLNPEYSNYQLSNTAVYVDNLGDIGEIVERKIVNALSDRGVKSSGVRELARFSSSQEEFVKKVWNTGVSEVLVVAMSDSQGTATHGYHSFGTTQSFNGTTSSQVTTMPMLAPQRSLQAQATVLNADGEKIWTGNTERSAQGLLFIGDELTASETTTALMDALSQKGLISKL
nr:hypothetical protein [uncultured Halomonas sp.]